MIPSHVSRLVVAIFASILLTSTVVGPLAYGAHSARLESRIIEKIRPKSSVQTTVPTSTTTTTVPTSTTTPGSTLPPAPQPSVLGTHTERDTAEDSGSGATTTSLPG